MNSSMTNSTYDSLTKISTLNSKVNDSLILIYLTLMCVSYLFFLYFLTVILTVFFSTVQIRENPRYLLFVHMLVTDTIYLTLGIFLSLSTLYVPLYIPVPICYILIITLSTAFKVTPYNLAVMALERYVAICFPLRHGELCTRHNSVVAIAVIWVIGFIPNIVDFAIMISNQKPNFFSLRFKCSKTIFINVPEQDIMRNVTNVLSFVLVGLVMVFTYIQIMLIALNFGSKNSLASKAGKTIMLHALQLLLCMTAFSHNITEVYFKEYLLAMARINFLFFMCLPRSLSPLIYGLRDEMLRNYIKKFVLCYRLKVSPIVN
ncbi:odorant receptor 131-2-like [Pelobates fuscus]|uniref:odorant receptor 131-2-like n=1 Tax=Pelobates fuscus TaxID=191477 RepID=UPI002FE44A79